MADREVFYLKYLKKGFSDEFPCGFIFNDTMGDI